MRADGATGIISPSVISFAQAFSRLLPLRFFDARESRTAESPEKVDYP